MSIFSEQNKKRRNSNQFDMSYEKKFSGKFGNLIPFYREETLPGDNFQCNGEIKLELAPLLSDLNHMVDVHLDYFWVSYDSIWSNWRDFISGGENLDQNPTLPYVTMSDSNKQLFKTGTLSDYLGIPVWDAQGVTPTVLGSENINALPFRVYQHIYNEWYRDQDLISKVDIQKTTDGLSNYAVLGALQKSAWQNDLFTSARPEAQKGDPVNFLAREGTTEPNVIRFDGTGGFGAGTPNFQGAGATADTWDGYMRDVNNNSLDLYATVAQLRKGEALQKFYEAMQRGGNRYNEYLNTMWGVDDQDRRLQIPELIHSSQHPLKIQEVLTTTNADNTTTDDNTAAQAYGRATSYGNGGFQFSAPDYGMVMGIVKIVPRPAYFNPLPEYYTRTDRFEWYTDHLAEIGEDVILKKEINSDPLNPGSDNNEFGYHHRYYSFKTRHDEISGDFKYGLNFRHLGRDVTTYPTLNQDFIEIGGIYDTNSLTRIFNVIDPDLDYIWGQVFNDVTISRDVKYISTPM